MFEGLENELIARTAVTYLAESIIGLVLSLAFVYFSKVYHRPFMKTWALPKIFEMFYRAETKVDGTGLGLYIVKEALSKINGRIAVKSEYGQGTVFTITLPTA